MLMPVPNAVTHDNCISTFLQTGHAKIIGVGREVKGRRKDGSLFPLDLSVAEWREGCKSFFTGIMRDITLRKKQEKQVETLLHEVNHRSKNMLAVVQAIARQTLAVQPDNFIRTFEERIHALSANQDLLVKSAWTGVYLEELVRSQLAPFKDFIGSRIELAGPSLLLSADASQAIGMALHELATNAGKYGALSNSNGRVTITWSLESSRTGEEIFVMTWLEEGGPPVSEPKRRGFGSTIIGRVVEQSLDGKVEFTHLVTGVRWRLECRALDVLEGKRATGNGQDPKEPGNSPAASVSKGRLSRRLFVPLAFIPQQEIVRSITLLIAFGPTPAQNEAAQPQCPFVVKPRMPALTQGG